MVNDNRIDILITKFICGEALPEEAMELGDWINMSPQNKSYFNSYSKIFSVNVDITYNDKNRAWENINDTIIKEKKESKYRVINWRFLAIAASVVLIFSIGLVINNYSKKETGSIVYSTETTIRKIVLKDNSEIIISANSSITTDRNYGVSNRKITLNGSAAFSIIHNPSQALIIDVNTLHIKDIGTKFSVSASPGSDTIFIKVDEGGILVYDDFGSSENAGAGENVIYIKSKKKIIVFRVNQDVIIPTTKKDSKVAETKKTKDVKKILPAAAADTAEENPGYIEQSAKDLKPGDSTQSQKIVTDLVRDGLIVRGQPLSFVLSDTAFILNGKKQSAAVLARYLGKYRKKSNGPWSWGHGENNPPKK
jgi:transmembrane sensor